MRAVAILAVLGFHGFPHAVPGGFVGVDIFFVISGYLISGIIRSELERNSFSLTAFYQRRVRRIFPALIIVLAATFVVGRHLLLDDEFQRLGKHILAGAGFVSNFVLWSESGYFDSDANLKPLLHLWSLGIEEQFYIAWPLLLLLGWIRLRHAVWKATALIALASFVLNVWLASTSPAAAFYSPLGRMWELGLGAVLALYSHSESGGGLAARSSDAMRLRERGAWMGAALITIAVVGFDRYVTYPGVAALLPTVGAAALIWAGPNTWLNSRVLGHRVLVYIGLISYPLYLWHWPLLALQRIARPDGLDTAEITGVLIGSFVLAGLTYHLVELRARSRTWRAPAIFATMSVIAVLAICSMTSLIRPWSSGRGFEKIFAAMKEERYPGHALNGFGYRGAEFLKEGSGTNVTVLIGDSSMQQYFMRIDKLLHERRPIDRTVVFATMAGCPPVPGIEAEKVRHFCGGFARAAAAYAQERSVDSVVISARWNSYFSNKSSFVDYLFADESGRYPLGLASEGSRRALISLGTWIAELVHRGKRVYLVLDTPYGDRLAPTSLVRRSLFGGFTLQPTWISRHALNDELDQTSNAVRATAEANGAIVIDPADSVCDDSRCQSLAPSGDPMYMDATHLSPTYIKDHVDYLDAAVLP